MTETPLRTFLSPILRVLRRLCFRADMHYNLRDVCLNSLKKEKKVLKLKPRDWFWHSRTGMLSRKSIINKYFPRTSQWTPPKHSVRYIEFSPYRLIIEQQTTLLQQSYVHPNCIHFFFFLSPGDQGRNLFRHLYSGSCVQLSYANSILISLYHFLPWQSIRDSACRCFQRVIFYL